MTTIGGKHRKPKLPSQPQFVVQIAAEINQYLRIDADQHGLTVIAWTGDPNGATKFNSKYEAKQRTREIENIPETRVFKVIEKPAAN